jgi:phage shock protein A
MNETMLNNMNLGELAHFYYDDPDPRLQRLARMVIKDLDDFAADQKTEQEETIDTLEEDNKNLRQQIEKLSTENKTLHEKVKALTPYAA